LIRILAAAAGLILLALVLVDAFNTLLLARRTRHVFRIARYYRLSWTPFASIGRRIQSPLRREGFLSIYGPLSLLLLLFGLWTLGLVAAFGLLQWAVGMQPSTVAATFANDVFSAGSLFTLMNGDPKNPASRAISVIEGGLGLGFPGLVIGYLPVLYQSFLPTWSPQLLENQLSFPMLARFRSQHANQAWLTALLAIMDCAAALSLCGRDDLRRQAKLAFAMGRRIVADRAPSLDSSCLSQLELERKCRLYEPLADALSGYFMMALPAWIPGEANRDTWRAGIMDRDEAPLAVSDPFAQ
jgi:hypothetical protein